ncbi:MAG TPA: glycosyltransferase family A protein [Gemmatimonadaceae bacterium]|nr:glycosyltransferase family A protein [Gemmatimonadaceae bacterium]
MVRTLPLSVVLSVRNAATTLGEVLLAIRASDLSRESYEIIVVDDASSDSSVAIAARHADTVVKLTGRPSGTAYARNRGVELARGDVVVFVDGDAVVRPDTLTRVLATLAENPEVDAVSASRDPDSGAGNFISQYWNLLLRFGEQHHAGNCAQFAPGCGAIRRPAFISTGMYDEWRFSTPSLESVELGGRLLGAGRGALLSSDVKVMHLKEWTIGSVCEEVWRRSSFLARSLGYSRMNALAPSEVVFTLSRALIPAALVFGTLMLVAAFIPPPHIQSEVALGLVVLVMTNLPLHRFYVTARGFAFAAMSAPIHIIVQLVAAVALCTGWVLRYLMGDVSPDATTQAYSEVGLETWPPIPRKLR